MYLHASDLGGTVTRGPSDSDTESNIRTMPRKTAHACYAARKPEYDDLQRGLKKVSPDDVKASILLISACQENEVAGDGDANGKFTTAVLKVWDKGGFQGNYEKFHKEITQKLEESYEVDKAAHARGETTKKAIFQTPNFDKGNIENDAFSKGAPFSI